MLSAPVPAAVERRYTGVGMHVGAVTTRTATPTLSPRCQATVVSPGEERTLKSTEVRVVAVVAAVVVVAVVGRVIVVWTVPSSFSSLYSNTKSCFFFFFFFFFLQGGTVGMTLGGGGGLPSECTAHRGMRPLCRIRGPNG